MKTKKKLFTSLAALTLAGVSLTGCAADQYAGIPEPGSGSTVSASPTTKAPKEVESKTEVAGQATLDPAKFEIPDDITESYGKHAETLPDASWEITTFLIGQPSLQKATTVKEREAMSEPLYNAMGNTYAPEVKKGVVDQVVSAEGSLLVGMWREGDKPITVDGKKFTLEEGTDWQFSFADPIFRDKDKNLAEVVMSQGVRYRVPVVAEDGSKAWASYPVETHKVLTPGPNEDIPWYVVGLDAKEAGPITISERTGE